MNPLRSRYRQAVRYIYWKKEAQTIHIEQKDFFEIFDKLDKKKRVISSKCRRDDFPVGAWAIETCGSMKRIYVCEGDGNYKIYATNYIDNGKNTEERVTGRSATAEFMRVFRELKGGNKKTFYNAFGTVDESLKTCTPRSFVYNNERAKGVVIKHVSAIDATSHYPSYMCGKLPTSHGMKRVDGEVEPSEEFPFAFYPENGELAEFGGVDTRKWNASPFADCFMKDETFNDVTYTILMKASTVDLSDVWEYFFQRRKEDETSKAVMNCTIGMLHTKIYNSYKYAHLSAVAIARANDRHIKIAEEIGKFNVLQISVDSIIYRGLQKYGEDVKALGKYHQEFIDVNVMFRGQNCFVMKDQSGNVVKVRHAAYNFNKDGTPIKAEEVTDYKDMYNWIKVDYMKEMNKIWDE